MSTSKNMSIPKDEVESGSGRRGTVYARFYGASEAEVWNKRSRYLDEWPTPGYGTTTATQPYDTGRGYWACVMSRSASCD